MHPEIRKEEDTDEQSYDDSNKTAGRGVGYLCVPVREKNINNKKVATDICQEAYGCA